MWKVLSLFVLVSGLSAGDPCQDVPPTPTPFDQPMIEQPMTAEQHKAALERLRAVMLKVSGTTVGPVYFL